MGNSTELGRLFCNEISPVQAGAYSEPRLRAPTADLRKHCGCDRPAPLRPNWRSRPACGWLSPDRRSVGVLHSRCNMSTKRYVSRRLSWGMSPAVAAGLGLGGC